ncbi:MAG: hypothetical protein QG620_361 [Patescibacteria group bacterium]|nr:hypothetical protein [Patescibacteria group bacterium]
MTIFSVSCFNLNSVRALPRDLWEQNVFRSFYKYRRRVDLEKHKIVSLAGIGFDGYVTCQKTNRGPNSFLFETTDDGVISPSTCRCCGDKLVLQQNNELGDFQKVVPIESEWPCPRGF